MKVFGYGTGGKHTAGDPHAAWWRASTTGVAAEYQKDYPLMDRSIALVHAEDQVRQDVHTAMRSAR